MDSPRNYRFFIISAVVLIFVALIPLLLVVSLATPDTANLKEIAQRTANEFDRLIQLRQQEVFTFAAFPSIRAFTSSTPETRSQRASVALNELQALVASDTNIREAFIADKNGIVIMTTLEGWNSDISARQFVRDALAGQLAASPVAYDRGEYSNYYAAPVLNNQKEIVGALVARIAAQELWSVLPKGANWYTVLSDENGVRLDDTGDPRRRMASFGGMDAARAARIVKELTYGALLLAPRATQQEHAQQLLTQGALDQLRASDFSADAVAAQRLVSKPWTVLALAPQPTFAELFSRLLIPLGVALVLALGGALLLTRLI